MTTFSNIADDAIERDWATNPRWAGVERSYDATDVIRLRGSVRVDHSLARRGAELLWRLLHTEDYVSAGGAITGAQAVQTVNAGFKAIHLSGAPAGVRCINNALLRADQIDWAESFAAGDHEPQRDWLVPIVADAEAGFEGALNAYELMHSMIEAGAAAVQFDDPTGQTIRTLNAARLAADVAGVPSILMARTDSLEIDISVARGLAYAPYADVLWCETATPDAEAARIFAERIRAEYPDKLLAYSCSPLFNWREHRDGTNLDDDAMARFQRELGAMGYALQLVGPEEHGDGSTDHQRDAAAEYFDDIAATLSGGMALR